MSRAIEDRILIFIIIITLLFTNIFIEIAKDEKLNKWIEAMTPRRAMDYFFDHATPVKIHLM